MEKQTVTISIERYETLIKKEILFDKMVQGKEVAAYPYVPKETKPEEVSND